MLQPTDKFPLPEDFSDERPKTLMDTVAVAAATAEVQVAMGAPLGFTEKDLRAVKAIAGGDIRDINSRAAAVAAGAFLRAYGAQLAFEPAVMRAAITNKLLEIADCGDVKYELRALELLGKHCDVGLFTERSEITINHSTPESLEEAILARVRRLMDAQTIDVTPQDVTSLLEASLREDEDLEVEEAQFTEWSAPVEQDDG